MCLSLCTCIYEKNSHICQCNHFCHCWVCYQALCICAHCEWWNFHFEYICFGTRESYEKGVSQIARMDHDQSIIHYVDLATSFWKITMQVCGKLYRQCKRYVLIKTLQLVSHTHAIVHISFSLYCWHFALTRHFQDGEGLLKLTIKAVTVCD